ncbi:hypothetical protein CDCA_CDCA19G4699 [Cyanidium caldarium]|uniref:Helix-turn-helix domain-containing protein n=1 Tax=Cyanidium caldarium TaxID=2771 RepID=A0AAV9J292_CYACA|nr:hypothetical protein CDCA_CDCA19G4699 [Cyanidium caldarium]
MDPKLDGEEAELYIGGPEDPDGHLGAEEHVHEEVPEEEEVGLDLDGKNRGLTVARAAKLFAVHPKTIRRWCDAGKLEFFRTAGGHRRIRAGTAPEIFGGRGHVPAPPASAPGAPASSPPAASSMLAPSSHLPRGGR